MFFASLKSFSIHVYSLLSTAYVPLIQKWILSSRDEQKVLNTLAGCESSFKNVTVQISLCHTLRYGYIAL